MKVTQIRLRLLNSGAMVAVGTIEFNECLVVNFRFIKGKEEYFVKLGEATKGRDGNWYDSVYIKDKDFNAELNVIIAEEFNKMLNESKINFKEQQTA